MCDQAFPLEPWLKQTGCPRDPLPVSLDVTIAPVNMVKASARQKAGSQHPEGFDKTKCVFIPNYDRAPGFQVVHKGKICMKYLSLSKNKNKPNPANAWTWSIFSCNIQKLLKNWVGNCFRKGQNLPNCLLPKGP